MEAIITFKEESSYYKHGEEKRVVENLTEVHYSYNIGFSDLSTAFESDIDGTGFTIRNKDIEQFEIFP